jgi:secreted trypsin-like serine protease
VAAAHCVNGQSTSVLTVYAGIQQLSQRTTTDQSRNVSIITVHPSYTSSAFINDVAVLTLQSSELHWTPNSNSNSNFMELELELEFHNRKFVELELELEFRIFFGVIILELYQ